MELNKKGLPFFPELRFEDKRHIYTLGGQILPSVTTVMKPLDEALYRGIDESVMQMAAERGTAIHNAAENFAFYNATKQILTGGIKRQPGNNQRLTEPNKRKLYRR